METGLPESAMKMELHPEIRLGESWDHQRVPYHERQVYGAQRKVHVELCQACPLLKSPESSNRNRHGQIGTCRASAFGEAEKAKMNGQALCEKPVTK